MGGCAKAVIVVLVLGVIGTIGFLTMCGTAVKQVVDEHAAQEAAFQAQEAIPVTARQLNADYQANEVSANDKYKGKKLAVTGTVTDISVDIGGDPVLILDTGEMLESVHASFPKEAQNSLASVSKGTSVTVTCRGGMMVMKSPTLDDCVLN
jgi:hypothetical protein